MAKELVIRNGFVIYSNNTYSEEITGITTDLDISSKINELATANSIKNYVDSVNSATTINNLSDTTITQPEQTGQTLVWDSGSWINTGISYFYSDLDSRYVNLNGDTMTGNLTLPGLTATTIDSTNINAISTTTDTLNLASGITVWSIQNATGQTTSSNTLLTEDVIINLFETTNELSELTDVNLTNIQTNDILIYTGSEWENTGKSYLDDLYVNQDGDTMTGDLTIDTLSGTNDRLVYVNSNGKLQESDEYVYKIPTVSAGVGTTNIDTISSGISYGCVWHYYVEDGTNYRSGIINSVWGNGSIEFNETSTRDIGDTTNIDFDVILSSGNVIIQSNVDSGSWNVKVVRMII
jgi:hypothetical protein